MSYFEELSPRRARQIGYGGGYFDSDARPAQTSLSPEDRESLLGAIGGRTAQATELLLNAIDTPASWLRDTLAGNPLGSRTSAGELLDSYNLRPSEDALGGWGRPLAEFATGAVLDPLNLIGVGGLSKAGQAVKGAGMLDDAARVMSKKLIANNDTGSWVARDALKSWAKNFGKKADDLTDADLAARPLAGTWQSARELTPTDILNAQANRAAARGSIDDALAKTGSTFNDVADMPLRYDIGLGLPFSDYNLIGMNLPGGGALAKGVDRIKQVSRWSAPLRYGHAFANRDVFGATDEAGQIVGTEIANAARQGETTGRAAVASALQGLDPSTFDDATGDAMRRLLRGEGTQADQTLLAGRSDLKDFLDLWHGANGRPGLAAQFLNRRAVAGLASNPLIDRWGAKYFPRHIDDLAFASKIEQQGGKGGVRGGRAFSTMTGDQLGRKKFLSVPGGEDFLNKLSLDPQVAGSGRALLTDDDAAKYIKAAVDAEAARRFPGGVLPNGAKVPSYSIQSAKRLARVLNQLDDNAVKNKLPIFGSHFTDDFSRYVVGNEKAMAVSDALYDLLGSTAKAIPAGAVQYGGHVPMTNALKRLGLRTIDNRNLIGPLAAAGSPSQTMLYEGAQPQVLKRLAQRLPGFSGDIKDVSLDKPMLDRLTRIADFHEYPEVQQKWLKAFDDLTRIWKGSILSWPARFTRDWYSGGFSNLVEVGSVNDFIKGNLGAKHLVQGDWNSLDGILSQMPKYANLTPAARKTQFTTDLAAGGLLGGRRSVDFADHMNALRSGQDVANEYLPGMNPRTTLGMQAMDVLSGRTPLGADKAAYSELGKNWGRFHQMGMKNPRDVGNPILRWGAKLGDTTDSLNRASGYIALLLQGVDPMEAAKRIKLAHVDYSSLTAMERATARRIAPFWAYTSRTGKWVADKMMERPGGRFTQLGIRLPAALMGADKDEYVPESIRSNYGMPNPRLLPSRLFGEEKPGVTPWLTDIDLPGIDQINMIRPGFKPGGDLDISATGFGTLKDIAGKQLHPWAKSALEALTGENLYTKRPMKDFDPAINQLAEDWLGIHPSSSAGLYLKAASPLVDAVPFVPRVLQISNRLSDDEKIPDIRDRAYQMGINAFSGVKFQNVDDKARRIDARKKIGEILEEDPLIRSFTQPYLPEEALPYADPQLVQLMALERQLGRELKRERDAEAGRLKPTRMRHTDPMSYFE